MTKRETLICLLERYHELAGSAGGGLGGKLNGDALLLPQHDQGDRKKGRPRCQVYTTLRCTC